MDFIWVLLFPPISQKHVLLLLEMLGVYERVTMCAP